MADHVFIYVIQIQIYLIAMILNYIKDNLFGGELIYLELDLIYGMNVKNIDPEIRKYIGFGDDEFESFPLPVQDRFLNEAAEEYITELKKIKIKYRISETEADYSGLYLNSNIYVDTTDGGLYKNSISNCELCRNNSIYDSAVDTYIDIHTFCKNTLFIFLKKIVFFTIDLE
jgi:hypothetical protein